ncbi:MAG: menaquinol-cytochrome c reductase iron-sulfur subunit [Pirellulaceae bacterium]|jgi:menaquinol-cytochrome c reductase iron-sulfur subunit
MSDSSVTPEKSSDAQPRRNFVAEFAAIAIGGVISLVSLISGLAVFIDPISRQPQVPLAYREPDGGSGDGGSDGFIRICSLEAVPADGLPRRFPVITDQIDAWNFTPDQPVGAVYLIRDKLLGELKIFHATCPHAGCSVAPNPANTALLCPCHNSSFNLDGEKIDQPGKENPSPRALDRLEYDEKKFSDQSEIWVKYVDYYTGIHEQKPKL